MPRGAPRCVVQRGGNQRTLWRLECRPLESLPRLDSRVISLRVSFAGSALIARQHGVFVSARRLRGWRCRCRRPTPARDAPSSWTLSSFGIFSAARRRSWEATPAYRTTRASGHVHTSCRRARPNRPPDGWHGIRRAYGSSIGKLPRSGANAPGSDLPRRLSTSALAAAMGDLHGTTAPPPQRAARSLPVGRRLVGPLQACSGAEVRGGSCEGRRAAAAASRCGAAWRSSVPLSSARRSAHRARPAHGMAPAARVALAPAARQPLPEPARRPPTTTSCKACSGRTRAARRATSSSAPRCPRCSRAPRRRLRRTSRPGRPPRHHRRPRAGGRHPAALRLGGGELQRSGSPSSTSTSTSTSTSSMTSTACGGPSSPRRAARSWAVWAARRAPRPRRVSAPRMTPPAAPPRPTTSTGASPTTI